MEISVALLLSFTIFMLEASNNPRVKESNGAAQPLLDHLRQFSGNETSIDYDSWNNTYPFPPVNFAYQDSYPYLNETQIKWQAQQRSGMTVPGDQDQMATAIAKCYPDDFAGVSDKLGVKASTSDDNCKCLKESTSFGESEDFDECCAQMEGTATAAPTPAPVPAQAPTPTPAPAPAPAPAPTPAPSHRERRAAPPSNAPASTQTTTAAAGSGSSAVGGLSALDDSTREDLMNKSAFMAECLGVDDMKVGGGGYRFTDPKDTGGRLPRVRTELFVVVLGLAFFTNASLRNVGTLATRN